MTSGTISEFRKLIFDRLLPIPAFPKFYSLSSQQPNIISLFSTKFPSGYLPRFQSRSARSNPAPKIPHLCKKGGKHYDSVGDQKSAEFREFCWKSKESRIERGSVCRNFESKNPSLPEGILTFWAEVGWGEYSGGSVSERFDRPEFWLLKFLRILSGDLVFLKSLIEWGPQESLWPFLEVKISPPKGAAHTHGYRVSV
jgi:hypothetical protein